VRDIGQDVVTRMYLRGVCTNALTDWLGITKDELFEFMRSSNEWTEDESTTVKVIAKSSMTLSNEVHRCKYCKKPGKMYHIHHDCRTLCLNCLTDKLNYGDKRYENYAWTSMTKDEIYAAFVNCYVGGFTASMSGWEECATVNYIGTHEGVTEWCNWQDQSCTVIPGRFPRYDSIIKNSDIKLEQLIGIWHNRPIETEKLYSEFMEIYPDGIGIYTDHRGSELLMDWYIDGDILNISIDDRFTFYRGPFYLRETDSVTDIHKVTHTYPSLGWTEHDEARFAIKGKYYKIS